MFRATHGHLASREKEFVYEAYLKHHGDKQTVCMQVPEKMKRETMCGGERESEISKQKVLCWNPIVCIHMVPELELTLGICVRDIIIL